MSDIESKARDKHIVEEFIRREFEATLPDRIARATEFKQHPIVPNHHFAGPSAECFRLWRDGYFISTLMVSQAIVEGICRLVLDKNILPYCGNPPDSANILVRRNLITANCEEAIRQIWKSFRNDIHHMNPRVADVQHEFKKIAQRNIRDLQTIEEEIFAFDITPDGKVVPKNPLYWNINANGTAPVFLKQF